MNASSQIQPLTWPIAAWSIAAFAGLIAPVCAVLLISNVSIAAHTSVVLAPVIAIGMMAAGMIGAACAGRFWIGIILAIAAGAGLLIFAKTLGIPSFSNPLTTGVVMLISSISFAARGALFVCSAAGRGWLIAVFVVAGEAAILVTAMAQPGALPAWLLVWLPAQWANIAIQTALAGNAAIAASSTLIALGGTAAATLLVARLWPRRWPYLIMFTTWIALSALVWYRPAPPLPAPTSTDVEIGHLSITATGRDLA